MNMYENFNLVNAMRNAIISGFNFGEFIAGYQGIQPVNKCSKLWARVEKIVDDESWKRFLEDVAVVALREFSERIQNVKKKGLTDQEIMDCLDFDKKVLSSLLQPI